MTKWPGDSSHTLSPLSKSQTPQPAGLTVFSAPPPGPSGSCLPRRCGTWRSERPSTPPLTVGAPYMPSHVHMRVHRRHMHTHPTESSGGPHANVKTGGFLSCWEGCEEPVCALSGTEHKPGAPASGSAGTVSTEVCVSPGAPGFIPLPSQPDGWICCALRVFQDEP